MVTALVTGANSGIGLEIARQLLRAGCKVYVNARDVARGRAAVGELGPGAELLSFDVTDVSTVEAAAATVHELDVLVNNAGIHDGGAPATEQDLDTFRRVYETNVFGVVTVTNAFLPALRRSEKPRIVNISSGTGSLAWSTGPNPQFDHTASAGTSAAYRSSKAALNALTVFYAQALAADEIKVNALAPGRRATNFTPRAMETGDDPQEAAAQAVTLALLEDDGPSGALYSWDGTAAPW